MEKIILYKLIVGIWSAVLSSNIYVADTPMTEVVMEEEKPDVTEQPQMYKKWARISDEWKEIFENTEKYPENLLKNLKRNPEILDFVYGYPDALLEPAGGLSIKEKLMKCPLLIQWDQRWGYVPYGSYNIGISGCGPTCLSMVIYNYLRDETLTPVVLAKKAMDGGYYVPGAGTAWTYLINIPKEYGLEVTQHPALEETAMIECLENGGILITSMSPGDFTDTGHFIVVYKYKDGKFTVNDPFSYTNSYKSWDYETLAKQMKQVWCYNYSEEEFTSDES